MQIRSLTCSDKALQFLQTVSCIIVVICTLHNLVLKGENVLPVEDIEEIDKEDLEEDESDEGKEVDQLHEDAIAWTRRGRCTYDNLIPTWFQEE